MSRLAHIEDAVVALGGRRQPEGYWEIHLTGAAHGHNVARALIDLGLTTARAHGWDGCVVVAAESHPAHVVRVDTLWQARTDNVWGPRWLRPLYEAWTPPRRLRSLTDAEMVTLALLNGLSGSGAVRAWWEARK